MSEGMGLWGGDVGPTGLVTSQFESEVEEREANVVGWVELVNPMDLLVRWELIWFGEVVQASSV
jgi:hypothetical protein